MLKKELIGLLICTLLITVAVVPGINALTTNQLRVDSQQSVLITNGGIIDKIDIYCKGPFLFQILIRECVFTVSFLNNHNERINLKLEVNVTTPDDTLLFHPGDPFYAWLDPTHEGNVQYWTFIDFRKAGHLFGFFDINVKLTVRDDGSERKEVFHCLIFGISAIIFNRQGEIIE